MLVCGDAGGMEARYGSRHILNDSFMDTSYDVIITATQTLSNGSFGFSSAAGGVGSRADHAYKNKVKKYKDLMAQWNTGGRRFQRFEPVVFETSGFSHPCARSLIWAWEKAATLRNQPRRPQSGALGTRRDLSTVIQYWNAVSIILRAGSDLLVQEPVLT